MQPAPQPHPAPMQAPRSNRIETVGPSGRRIDTLDGRHGDVSMRDQGRHGKKSSKAWIILVFILLVGIAAAVAIGMSGPKLGGDSSDSEGSDPAAGAASGDPGATPAAEPVRDAEPNSAKNPGE